MKKELIILFDLDGTLIDSTDAILESFYFAFEEQMFNYKKNDEDIKRLIGYPLELMFESLGVPKPNVINFIMSYKKHYRKISGKKTFLLPGAKEAVEMASKIGKLGIVTTKTTQYSIPLLKNFGILQYFETIIGRQEVINPKPDSEPIKLALQKMNYKTSDVVYMIGDTKLDLISASRANVKSIGLLSGYGTMEELQKHTNTIVENIHDAIRLIYKNNF